MIYYSIGSALVSAEERSARKSEIKAFHSALATRSTKPVSFRSGVLNQENVVRSRQSPAGPVPFKEIGLGKPLSVRISEAYTGEYRTGIFGGRKDLLISTAVKSIATFDAKARALNFVEPNVAKKARLTRPAPTRQGTPYVFYSPALLERSLTAGFTMVFDTFPEDVFEKVGAGFEQASGVPIFIAHSTVLLAASAVIKLVGQAGEALFDGRPEFDQAEALDIELPGQDALEAGFRLITDSDLDVTDPTLKNDFMVDARGQVVSKADGTQYTGATPYFVICCDGTEMPELKAFAPTAVSASVLDRFFGAKNGQEVLSDVFLAAMKTYNDVYYRKKVEAIDEELKESGISSEKKAELLKAREAFIANILDKLLKPTSP